MSQYYRSESPAQTAGQAQPLAPAQPQRLALLAALGIIGQVLLPASAWLLPLVSEYRLVTDTISELALGRYGWIQTAAFALSGLGVLGLAYAIRQLTAGAWGSRTGSLLLGVYGIGALLVAIFPTDRIDAAADLAAMSTTGTIHSVVALVSFLCATAGTVVLTWTFSKAAAWRPLTPWAAILATAAVSLMLGQIFDPQGPWAGLLQRGLVTVIAGWLIAAALRIRQIAATVQAAPANA